MDKIKVGLVSLGCDKNRVDSEIVLSKLNKNFEIVKDEKDAEIILVNTCGFIEASKAESINTILEMAEHKTDASCKLLVATGCLTQRYGDELSELIPEIDLMLGVNDYDKLETLIDVKFNNGVSKEDALHYSDTNINEGERILTTNTGSAYMRISEGCDKLCTYCIIPKIRGKYRSRKLESIVTEAKSLVAQGVKEIILIAQDSANYGIDLYNEKRLHVLIKELSLIDGLKWIRLMYCYPEEMYDDLIEEFAVNEKVCKYLDMPIQHINSNVLKRMNRKSKHEDIVELIAKLRSKVPELVLRTSIIVGFPGETEEDFEELKSFVEEIKFDNLGVFKYSREEDTPAFKLPNQVEEDVKAKREEALMIIQQKISKKINKSKVGNIYEVLVEAFDGEMYVGRSKELAPDIDGDILFSSTIVHKPGDFVKVKITAAYEYDLVGEVFNESCE